MSRVTTAGAELTYHNAETQIVVEVVEGEIYLNGQRVPDTLDLHGGRYKVSSQLDKTSLAGRAFNAGWLARGMTAEPVQAVRVMGRVS